MKNKVLEKLYNLGARPDHLKNQGEVLSFPQLVALTQLNFDDVHCLILERFEFSIGFDVAVYFPKNKDKLYINTIFGLNAKQFGLLETVEMYCDRIGKQVVPFASDGHGNLVVYNSLTKEVFWWDHEALCEESDPQSFTKLSEEIVEFILNLEIDSDDMVDPEGSTKGLISVKLDF